jgi:hypothetical protein
MDSGHVYGMEKSRRSVTIRLSTCVAASLRPDSRLRSLVDASKKAKVGHVGRLVAQDVCMSYQRIMWYTTACLPASNDGCLLHLDDCHHLPSRPHDGDDR